MMFWQESGRRIAAEQERDAAQQLLAERDREISARDREISELRSLISDLQQRVAAQGQDQRPSRRGRRRRLRSNGSQAGHH